MRRSRLTRVRATHRGSTVVLCFVLVLALFATTLSSARIDTAGPSVAMLPTATLPVSFSFSPNPVSSGSSTTGTVTVTGGTSPYTLWFNNTAPGCSPNTNPETAPGPSYTFNCNPSGQGSYTIHLDVLDSSGNKGTTTTMLTVNGGGGGGGGKNGGNNSSSFQLPGQLLYFALIFGAVFLVAIVALAVGTILTAALVSRRLRQLTEVMRESRAPVGPAKPPQ